MSVWSTAFINNLPDSSFAYIESGGKKNSDGKTTPRSLRHLPYKDGSGKVDHNHTANALARLNGTQIPDSVKSGIRTKLQSALKTTTDAADLGERFTLSASSIKLDANGELPTRLPLFTTFDHPHSIKGNFSVDLDDLKQMKDNFDSGVGFPTEDASTGLPIDFEHKWLEKAAGWIKGLELQVDPSDSTKGTLYANPVEWTTEGAEAVKDGKYKMISPMGSFGKKNGKLSLWSNVNNLKEKLANVLEGAGLTNAPFQRGMQPIRTDRSQESVDNTDSGYGNVIYIYDVQQKPKESSMTIEEVRIKERDELTVPEYDLLVEKKDQLTKEEIAKFKLDAEEEEEEKLSDEDKATLTAIKDGSKKLVDATDQPVDKARLDRLEATASKYETEKVESILDKHVRRGAIKQDQTEFWSKQLLSATSEEQRKGMEDALDALPSNDLLAKEIGTGEDVNAGSTAREQLDKLAREKVDKAAKDGKELLYSDALKEVYREQKDLRTQDSQEQKTKAGALNAVGA